MAPNTLRPLSFHPEDWPETRDRYYRQLPASPNRCEG